MAVTRLEPDIYDRSVRSTSLLVAREPPSLQIVSLNFGKVIAVQHSLICDSIREQDRDSIEKMWIGLKALPTFWTPLLLCLSAVHANTEIINFSTKRGVEDARAAKVFYGHKQ